MKANIGLIGLAVMGENLALNMESKGFTVAVYNRSVPGEEGVVDRFINGRGKSKRFIGTHSIEQLVDSVKSPHIIMMMVKAGRPVDELISQLLPFLSSGDVIIDGGNSDFHDTERRVKELEKKGIYFVGTGISGGEEGALHVCDARRFGGSLAAGERHLAGNFRQVGRWFALLRVDRSGGSRPFCEDGAQRHRIWGYAAYFRSLFAVEKPERIGQRCDGRRL